MLLRHTVYAMTFETEQLSSSYNYRKMDPRSRDWSNKNKEIGAINRREERRYEEQLQQTNKESFNYYQNLIEDRTQRTKTNLENEKYKNKSN